MARLAARCACARAFARCDRPLRRRRRRTIRRGPITIVVSTRRRHRHGRPGAALRRQAVAEPGQAGGDREQARRCDHARRPPPSQRSPPDGHTLLVATSAALSINPTLYKQINYDPERDFVPISLYLKSPFILIVNPALPVKSVPELIDYAKKSPTPLNYQLARRRRLAASVDRAHEPHGSGCKMTHVPYRDSRAVGQRCCRGPCQPRASSRRAHRSRSSATASCARSRSRRTQRLPLHPNVPPFSEAANAPDFETVSWHVLLAPAKTPRPIVERLHAEMKRIMARPGDEEAAVRHRPDPARRRRRSQTPKATSSPRRRSGARW